MNSIRATTLKKIKEKLGDHSSWVNLEADIAMMCADLPEPDNNEKTKKFVMSLQGIKDYLFSKKIDKGSLKFLDEEIKQFKQTKMISVYENDDEDLDSELIELYARLGADKEGVLGIPHQLNYQQLIKLTNGVFKKTGLIKYYISKEKTIYGKIVAEIYEHAQKIPVASLVESKKKDKDTGESEQRIVNFGQPYDKGKYNLIKEVTSDFYVYRLITLDSTEMILLSSNQCEIGDYILEGVQTYSTDHRALTESARITTKLPFFIAQNVQNRVIKFKDHKAFFEKVKSLGITRKTFFEFPFTIKKGKKAYKLLQPEWYKHLIWSWLIHQPKGLFNNYPMHLMIIAEKHSGKSLMLNSLHANGQESRSIFSGSSSTLKHLIPSFKYNPARLGYLAESNRFSYCDEFLRCLVNTPTSKDGTQREESVALMNDLLEHQKREAGSGVSRVNVNMTSRVIATTNPIRNVKNVADLVKFLDESFLSRWMIYYQLPEHVAMIRHSDDSELKEYNFKIYNNDWISLVDYLHSFSAIYDMEKVKEVHSKVPQILNAALNNHYDARHKHHIECLIDGIVKTRCFLDGDESFEAIAEDYEVLKKVWFTLIKSWITPEMVKNIPIFERIYYVPERAQQIYWHIVKLKKSTLISEVKSYFQKVIPLHEFIESWNILIKNNLLLESSGKVRTHYMKEEF